MTNLHPLSLRCEYRTDPLGIDSPAPRFSWTLAAEGRDVRQTAYQIQADGGALWDSGKVFSSDTNQIAYAGAALRSGQRVSWKVRVWDEAGRESPWSAPAFWQMGLLSPADWAARWISLFTGQPNLDLSPALFLRRAFAVERPVARATLSATARGVYALSVNGRRVGDAHLAPGWTDYTKRIAYQTYDVTGLLQAGGNALGAMLGDGWYAGYVGFNAPGERQRAHYGDRGQMLAQLNVEYADGTRETVGTDGEWRAATGPILSSDMLMGEAYDARLEMPGWDTAGFDASAWLPVEVNGEGRATSVPLAAQADPPVRVTQELAAKAVTQPTPGTYLFDLGQNMVGWARLKVEGPAGTIVRLRFGEMITQGGALYVANLRSAKATDTYILKGGGPETFEPHFTFHGFRYVEVTGFPGVPSLDAVAGCVLHSDIVRTGTFACDSPMVNQLVSNIDWGLRGNFLSIPTDCPQRDERLGWMGDAQIFVRTAAGNRDVAAFFTKWMDDVEDAQSPEGGFPDVAPRLVDTSDGAPAWADAGVIVPWTIFQVYGDARILEKHYEAMARWIAYLQSANPGGLWLERRNNDFGDWLSIDAETDKDLLATAYYAYDAALMSRIAAVLGKAEDAARYGALSAHVKAAFNAAFVGPDARLKGDTQTAYVLALRFGLLPPELRASAAKHLVADIQAKNGHLSTGFVGVGSLCPVLTEAGYADVAYTLLLNDTFPSWGYSIKHGATTIWERWNGWTADAGFGDVGMNSFNHYSLGSVGEWLQRYVAGIDLDPDRPGFAHLRLRPHPDRRLGSVRASFGSIRGRLDSAWTLDGDTFRWSVTVPPNVTATISVPAADPAAARESGGLRPARAEDGCAVFEAGSGDYEFSSRL